MRRQAQPSGVPQLEPLIATFMFPYRVHHHHHHHHFHGPLAAHLSSPFFQDVGLFQQRRVMMTKKKERV